ncbi:MAG: Ada metal-binding domain-containing protein [Gemmatimonadota bacterium]
MPALDRTTMLRAFYARDAAYDGRFLTGVVTTGIYCIASCAARKPNEENVRFFATEAEARAAGLRACRRCRPDRFLKGVDPELDALERLVREVRTDPGRFADARALANRLGVGATKLNDLLRHHYHTTPAALLTAARVETARRTLASGSGRPLDAAFAAGFESASAFHEQFRRHQHMTPAAYAALTEARAFTLTLPKRYDPVYALRVMARDPERQAEGHDGRHAFKALHLAHGPAVLHFEFTAAAVHVRIEAPRPLGPEDVRDAHRVSLRVLGLAHDPAAFERRGRTVPEIARLTAAHRGLRQPRTARVFEALVWSIVGQQVNLTFAAALRSTLIRLSGDDAGAGLRAHPTPAAVAALDYADLTAHRFSRRKAEYLIDAARAVLSGALPLEAMPEGPASTAERTLLDVRGIGPWSAHYVMMRGCGFPDCVPVGDTGLTEALRLFHGMEARPNAQQTIELMAPFRPWRSLATAHLWRSLGDATGEG